ncbi:MAG: hypothetical protein R3C02_06400 [Planctomycetaceae bacterium]
MSSSESSPDCPDRLREAMAFSLMAGETPSSIAGDGLRRLAGRDRSSNARSLCHRNGTHLP